MILKGKVKAGILLYALLMSALFTLMLQFYLGRVIANERQQIAQEYASKAYLIALVAKDNAKDTMVFEDAMVEINKAKGSYVVSVQLSGDKSYQYRFDDRKASDELANSSSSDSLETSQVEQKSDDNPESQSSKVSDQ
ncbi:competence type IV pilus minor pilin ComGG [Streptococcus sp. zg-JUN1979]|uniref:competence type IV pilus minor pilin ComGG n=1 Tax=Streptococcus sp. zg-JUN1979 TaxID=3391450 RepID=UPI0039A44759